VPPAGGTAASPGGTAAGQGGGGSPGVGGVGESDPGRLGTDPAPAVQAALLRRARAGDPAAFEELVTPLLQPAYQLAVRLLGDRDLAEDVTQEALVKAFTGIRGFRGQARLATWLFRIVHNACTDALRHRARRPSLSLYSAGREEEEGRPGDPPDPAPGPEERAMEQAGREAILRAVAALPPEFRAVVVLRDVQGLSYEEIAAITGVTLGTVKSRLHRARAALRSALGGP
jgi:RNA polymerase sigma-70 factor (ECF subfamily)